MTISIPVTIDCEGASNGGITASGVTAITINTTAPVNLIGLDLNGANTGGGNGIHIQSNGVVNIRNCKIHGFQINQGTTGVGIWFAPGSSGGILVVDNVLLAYDSYGIIATSGVGAINMTVRNSAISQNQYGIGVDTNGGTHAGATIEQTTLAFNGFGLSVSGTGAVALIGSSTVVNNSYGVSAINSGTIYSFKNNQIGGNGSDGTPLTAYPGPGPLN